MRVALALVLVACSDTPAPLPGEVSVTSDGGPLAHVTACLDSDFFGCHGSTINLDVIHGGKVTALRYGAFGVGYHAADVDLGDPTLPFAISDGTVQAEATLPPAFDLSGAPDGTLTRDGALHLTWDGAGKPMRWDFDYECGTLAGTVDGGGITDDGSADIDLGKVGDGIADAHVSTDTCNVLIKLSRIVRGSVDKDFHAKTASATQVRSISFTFER